jgi:hypothetical protein
MCIPASVIHRYKGSLLDRYFRKDFDGERQYIDMPNGDRTIYIERNPRVFRQMLKYIRSFGKMDLKPL